MFFYFCIASSNPLSLSTMMKHTVSPSLCFLTYSIHNIRDNVINQLFRYKPRNKPPEFFRRFKHARLVLDFSITRTPALQSWSWQNNYLFYLKNKINLRCLFSKLRTALWVSTGCRLSFPSLKVCGLAFTWQLGGSESQRRFLSSTHSFYF